MCQHQHDKYMMLCVLLLLAWKFGQIDSDTDNFPIPFGLRAELSEYLWAKEKEMSDMSMMNFRGEEY